MHHTGFKLFKIVRHTKHTIYVIKHFHLSILYFSIFNYFIFIFSLISCLILNFFWAKPMFPEICLVFCQKETCHTFQGTICLWKLQVTTPLIQSHMVYSKIHSCNVNKFLLRKTNFIKIRLIWQIMLTNTIVLQLHHEKQKLNILSSSS